MTERERLANLIYMIPYDHLDDEDNYNAYFHWKAADFLLDKGVIFPPVKVDDVVYIVYKKNVYPVTVCAVKIDTKTNSNRFCVEGWIQVGRSYEHRYTATFKWESVGKTVFLTREEAEKALTSK